MRVFLDTNVLVSAFATRGLCADLLESVLIGHELATGRTVLSELARALRTKIRLPAARGDDIVEFVRLEAALVVGEAEPSDSPVDDDDRIVLGEALAGAADAFVTGDMTLLALGRVREMRVLSPRQLWEELRAR